MSYTDATTVVPAASVSPFIPWVLPAGWKFLREFGDGYAVQNRNGLRAIVSTAPFEDGREWLHLSISRADRLPSYDDLKYAKEVFIGNERYAYQIFPPTSKHVNIHQFCLHLYAPLTGDAPLPDFTCGGESI